MPWRRWRLARDAGRVAILEVGNHGGIPGGFAIVRGGRRPGKQELDHIVDRLVDDDVVLTLVKDGDHRLSRPEDIALILDAVSRVTEE